MEAVLLIVPKETKGTGNSVIFLWQSHVSFCLICKLLMALCFRILVWEDGFCDFHECERAGSGYVKGRFGADIFFKMSHEVYNYGEG